MKLTLACSVFAILFATAYSGLLFGRDGPLPRSFLPNLKCNASFSTMLSTARPHTKTTCPNHNQVPDNGTIINDSPINKKIFKSSAKRPTRLTKATKGLSSIAQACFDFRYHLVTLPKFAKCEQVFSANKLQSKRYQQVRKQYRKLVAAFFSDKEAVKAVMAECAKAEKIEKVTVQPRCKEISAYW